MGPVDPCFPVFGAYNYVGITFLGKGTKTAVSLLCLAVVFFDACLTLNVLIGYSNEGHFQVIVGPSWWRGFVARNKRAVKKTPNVVWLKRSGVEKL